MITGIGRILKRSAITLIACLFLSSCDDASSSKSGSTTATEASKAAPTPPVPTGSSSKWVYSEDTDKMRGTTTRFAKLESDNELTFGFPYKGGPARLTLRQRPEDGLSVMLTVEGQFLCNSYSGDRVSVKFDRGAIQHFGCSEPSSATTGVLFINSEKRFLASLKKAKTAIIEAQFFQYGPRQIEFDVSGLNWK